MMEEKLLQMFQGARTRESFYREQLFNPPPLHKLMLHREVNPCRHRLPFLIIYTAIATKCFSCTLSEGRLKIVRENEAKERFRVIEGGRAVQTVNPVLQRNFRLLL